MVLRTIVSDCTFDQIGRLEGVRDIILSRYPNSRKRAYSFDLSAATDRLPISLQAHILSLLMGQDAAGAWAEILVNRDYQLPNSLCRLLKKMGLPAPESVSYTVGQPMGALSS